MEQKIRCVVMSTISGLFVGIGLSDLGFVALFLGLAVFTGLMALCMAIIE